jgi:hypothetical protein
MKLVRGPQRFRTRAWFLVSLALRGFSFGSPRELNPPRSSLVRSKRCERLARHIDLESQIRRRVLGCELER